MYTKNHINQSITPLKTDLQTMNKLISNMSSLQNQIKRKVLVRQQQNESKEVLSQQKIKSLNDQFIKLRELFTAFSSECKYQWITVYKQLLHIINNIVQLYQIKLQKLQQKIQSQQNTINKLRNTHNKHKLITQGYEGQNQVEGHNIMQSLEESLCIANKKVKISDVIASYQSSVISSLANIQEPDNNQTHILIETNKHLQSVFQVQSKFYQSNKSEMLKSNIQDLSLTQPLKKYNSKSNQKLINDSIEQKQNPPIFISSRKLSEFQQSKRSYSKTGRSRVRQTNEGSFSKLSELRKYLYNRTKM